MQRARGFLHQSRMAGGDEKQSFAGPQLRSKSRGLGTRLGAFRTTQKHAGASSSKTTIKDAKGVADKRSDAASEGGDRVHASKHASRNDESKERSEEDGSEASSDDDPTDAMSTQLARMMFGHEDLLAFNMTHDMFGHPSNHDVDAHLEEVYAVLKTVAQIKDQAVARNETFTEAQPFAGWMEAAMRSMRRTIGRYDVGLGEGGKRVVATHYQQLAVRMAKVALRDVERMASVERERASSSGGSGGAKEAK